MGTSHKHCTQKLVAVLAIALGIPLAATAAPSSLRAMNEAEMGSIAARGWSDNMLHQAYDAAPPDGTKVIGKLRTSLSKGLTFLEGETTLSEVSYDPLRAKTFVNPDGSITQILPNTIGEVSFDNIRVKGAAPGANFGSISIKSIDLTGTSLILAPKH